MDCSPGEAFEVAEAAGLVEDSGEEGEVSELEGDSGEEVEEGGAVVGHWF